MSCRPCAERRKRLLERRAQKKKQGKVVQAATIGAVLAVTQAAGKVLGIGEGTEDGNQVTDVGQSSSGSES